MKEIKIPSSLMEYHKEKENMAHCRRHSGIHFHKSVSFLRNLRTRNKTSKQDIAMLAVIYAFLDDPKAENHFLSWKDALLRKWRAWKMSLHLVRRVRNMMKYNFMPKTRWRENASLEERNFTRRKSSGLRREFPSHSSDIARFRKAW